MGQQINQHEEIRIQDQHEKRLPETLIAATVIPGSRIERVRAASSARRKLPTNGYLRECGSIYDEAAFRFNSTCFSFKKIDRPGQPDEIKQTPTGNFDKLFDKEENENAGT